MVGNDENEGMVAAELGMKEFLLIRMEIWNNY
jgi:hypothetical protein